MHKPHTCHFSSLISFLLIITFFHINIISVRADAQEDELFLVAQKALDDGFYDVAIRYIDQFLEKYPETNRRVEAQLLLGQCYFFKSQYLKAFDIFQKLLSFSEFQDATFFWLGETYFKATDYSQAKKYYRQLIDVYPNSAYIPQAYYSLAWTYFEQNDYKNAEGIFLKMTRMFPAHQLSEDAAFKLGECEHNLGAYETAGQYFKQYIKNFPQSTRHAEAYFYIAEGYYYLEDFLSAITYYAQTAEMAYDNKVIYMSKVSMGWSYLKLDKFELSRKHFDEARYLAEHKNILTDDIYLGQASLYSEMGETEKAREAYSLLIEKFPNSPRIADAHLGKANIDYTLKNYEQAINEYQWIIDKCTDEPQWDEILEKAHYGLAWTYLKSGLIDQSIKSFENIINKTKSNVVKVSALTQIGDAYQEINELEKALDIYDRVLENYPDSIYTDYVQFQQGITLLKLDKIEAGTLSFQSLQANFPQSKYIHDVKYYLGVAYFKKEDWRLAASYTEEYLTEIQPSQTFASEANYILALSYFHLKDYPRAMNVFQKLSDEFPDQKAVIQTSALHIAKCYYRLGREEEAIKAMVMIIETYPDSESSQEAMLWLGDHYLQKAQWEDAIFYYQQFIEKFPGSDKINIVRFELGQAYEVQEQWDKALSYYKLINDTTDKELYAKARLAIADIFSGELDPMTAIETYLNIARSVPEFKRDAYVKIAEIHETNNDYPKVIESYQSALKAKKALSNLKDAELQFNIGDAYELLNESERAVESYLRIPYLYAYDTLWIIKAYLRTARIFEDEGKWEEAKKVYGKIIDYQTEESKYAKERIDWMNENVK